MLEEVKLEGTQCKTKMLEGTQCKTKIEAIKLAKVLDRIGFTEDNPYSSFAVEYKGEFWVVSREEFIKKELGAYFIG